LGWLNSEAISSVAHADSVEAMIKTGINLTGFNGLTVTSHSRYAGSKYKYD